MYKCVLYYTCNTHRLDIELACRRQLAQASAGTALIAVSRGYEIPFGTICIAVEGDRSPLTMHRQILAGLERIDNGAVFLCESDVLYHPSHFDFLPLEDDIFYYNTNVWRLHWPDGHAVWTDNLQQVSGICARRDLLLAFYRRRVTEIEQGGFNRHYEPQPKTGCLATNRQSTFPNLDIRHNRTLTRSKWSPDEFRNKRYAQGWRETDDAIPDWGRPADILSAIQEGTWAVQL